MIYRVEIEEKRCTTYFIEAASRDEALEGMNELEPQRSNFELTDIDKTLSRGPVLPEPFEDGMPLWVGGEEGHWTYVEVEQP